MTMTMTMTMTITVYVGPPYVSTQPVRADSPRTGAFRYLQRSRQTFRETRSELKKSEDGFPLYCRARAAAIQQRAA